MCKGSERIKVCIIVSKGKNSKGLFIQITSESWFINSFLLFQSKRIKHLLIQCQNVTWNGRMSVIAAGEVRIIQVCCNYSMNLECGTVADERAWRVWLLSAWNGSREACAAALEDFSLLRTARIHPGHRDPLQPLVFRGPDMSTRSPASLQPSVLTLVLQYILPHWHWHILFLPEALDV